MNEENNNENWHHQRTFDFGDHQFGGYYQPGKLQFKWPEDLNKHFSKEDTQEQTILKFVRNHNRT